VKASLGTVVVIGALSLLVWTVVYIYNPSTPLTQGETVIVVGVCAALVLGVQWILSRVSGKRSSDEPHG
jgi:hypothetical protein